MDVMTWVRRTAAVGAGVSGLLHLLMLGHGDHLGWSLLMAAMAIICLPCAGHLWWVASSRSWVLIGVMNASMLSVHVWLLGTVSASAAQPAAPETGSLGAYVSHGHGGVTMSLAGVHDLLLPIASVVALAEVLLAMVGLYLLRRAGLRRERAGRAQSAARRC